MKITVLGGSDAFLSLLSSLENTELTRAATVGEALSLAGDALFLLPRYEEGETTIPELSETEAERLFELIGRNAFPIYVENYPAYDYRDCFALGAQATDLARGIGRQSICLAGRLTEAAGFEILQKGDGIYFPCTTHTDRPFEILAEVKPCIGVRRAAVSGERTGVALLKTGDNLFCAMCDLSRLADGRIFSYEAWQRFYSILLGEILGVREDAVTAAFARTYQRPALRLGGTGERRSRMEAAVLAALDWHEKSGVLLDGGDGGVYEMIRSFDLALAKNARGDSGLLTAALFAAAGKYFGNDAYTATAERIARCLFDQKHIQIEEGENAGLFKWFAGAPGMGAESVYVSDSSRVGNAVLALYRLGGREQYKRRAVMLGEALLSWFGGEPLLPTCYLNYSKSTVKSVQGGSRRCAAEFYDAPLLFLKNLYAVTGDERYRAQVIRTATVLAERYPNYDALASHSDNFTYGRLLGALAVAASFGDGPWTPVIDRLLLYFKERRHAAGGFAEGRAYFGEDSLGKNMEFAVGLGEEGASVADLVYCQNTMAYSLTILSRCGGSFDRALAAELLDGLCGFLLDIQILSDDPRTNGAWMRAFDMDHREYYGCDKDFAWGPYCILTGWVTGMIPLVFLDLLGLPNMF